MSEELFKAQQDALKEEAGKQLEQTQDDQPAPVTEAASSEVEPTVATGDIDWKRLSDDAGVSIGGIEDIKRAFEAKGKLTDAEKQLAEYESVFTDDYDISKLVSPELLKAQAIAEKTKLSHDKAMKLAKSEALSDLDYVVLANRIKHPSIKLSDSQQVDAILEKYDISEEDLKDLSSLTPGRQLLWSEAVDDAKNLVDGVLKDVSVPQFDSFETIKGNRQKAMQELNARIESEYAPVGATLASEAKAFKIALENGEFEFHLPDDFLSTIQPWVVERAKEKRLPLSAETSASLRNELNLNIWAIFGPKILESYGKSVASKVMAEADFKVGNPKGAVKTIENADAGTGDEQKALHTIAAKKQGRWG